MIIVLFNVKAEHHNREHIRVNRAIAEEQEDPRLEN